MAKDSSRLISLDIFRGFTITCMIVVAFQGNNSHVYNIFKNSEWNGCVPADFIFPFFIFIAGFAAYYSFIKYSNELNWKSLFRIIRRVVALFVLGLFLNIFPYFGRDSSSLRIMGILQRIAIVYGVGSIICLTVKRDYYWILIVIILLIYWGLMVLLGGSDPYALSSNIVGKTDILILGKKHLGTYMGVAFDQEGFLAAIPSLSNFLIGYYIAGMTTGNDKEKGSLVLKILLLGIASTGLGYFWNLFLPFNRFLWTGSFALYSSGIALSLFSFFYLVAEVLGLKRWAIFFRVFGFNAIIVFFFMSLWALLILFIKIPAGVAHITLHEWLYGNIFAKIAGNITGSLLFSVFHLIIFWLIALWFYMKEISIRL
jgi:predicted acyltransferase